MITRPLSEIKKEIQLIFYLMSNSLCPGVNISPMYACRSFTTSNSALTHGQPEERRPRIYQLHK